MLRQATGLWVGSSLTVISLLIIAWGFLPLAVTTKNVPIPLTSMTISAEQGSGGAGEASQTNPLEAGKEQTSGLQGEYEEDQSVLAGILERRRIILQNPRKMQSGEQGEIKLSIVVDPAEPGEGNGIEAGDGIEVSDPAWEDIYDAYNVMAEARLELFGMVADPVDTVTQPMRLGKPVIFNWQINAGSTGEKLGMVWLHLRFVPHDGGEAQDRTVFAHRVEIQVTDFLGMDRNTIRMVGFGGVFLGLGLSGYRFVYPMSRKKSGKD
jgi:hypothetical protein